MLVLVRKGESYEGSMPEIAKLKDEIQTGVLELNAYAQRGAKQSFMNIRQQVNHKVDKYIQLKTLRLV
jgi:hypothetical protein